jgi:hypothetical protein
MENDKGKKRQRNSISSTSSAQNSKKAKLGSVLSAPESPDEQRETEIAQKKFEEERDAVLASIPESYRALFGQIGFYPWSKSLLPVLIVSPYDVPPSPVRKQWLEMFNKVSFGASLGSLIVGSVARCGIRYSTVALLRRLLEEKTERFRSSDLPFLLVWNGKGR